MTSQVFPLLNAIQLLTGAENYPQWRFAMEDILTLTEASSFCFNGMDIVNGRWNIHGTLHVAAEGETLSQDHMDENYKLRKQREERNHLRKLVIAIINNRITPGLTASHTNDPETLWHDLADIYGTAGPLAIYALYQQTLGFRITGNKEPSAEIAQLKLIYNWLVDVSIPIPGIVQAMTLLGSMPEHWKIALSFLAAKGSVTGVTFLTVRATILQEYNQQQASKAQASRFSGVKKGGPRPPWQQQGRPQFQGGQQQQPGNNRPQGPQKKNHRGKKKPQQGAANTVAPATNDDYTRKDAGFVFTAKSGTKQVNSPATGPNAILAISHDPRPRPENQPSPGRFKTAKKRVFQAYKDRMDLLQEDIAVKQKKHRVANQRDKDTLQSAALSGMMAKLAKIQAKAEDALKVSCPPGILCSCEISITEERNKTFVPETLQEANPIAEAIRENALKQFNADNVSLGSEPDECETYLQYTYVHSSANIDQSLNFTQTGNVSQDLKIDTLGRDVIGSLAKCNMTRSDELLHSDTKSSAPDQISEKSNRLNKGEIQAPVSEDSDSDLVTTWLLDSGALRHLTTSLDDFAEYITGNFGNMTTAEQS
jgi:hypothetical protein